VSIISDGTNVVEGAAIVIGLLLLAKALQSGSQAVNNALNLAGVGATVAGTADFVGTTKPLTPAQADSLAKFIGVDLHGGSWQLSPNQTQIWFADGSYYDNTVGHFYNSSGQDLGDLLGNPGTPAPSGSILDDAVTFVGGA
jgi:hypothetical protein